MIRLTDDVRTPGYQAEAARIKFAKMHARAGNIMIHNRTGSRDPVLTIPGATRWSRAQLRRLSFGPSERSSALCSHSVVYPTCERSASRRSVPQAGFPTFSIAGAGATIEPNSSADAKAELPEHKRIAFPWVAAFVSWISKRHRRPDGFFDIKTPFRDALDLLPVAIFVVDQQGRITFANGCFAEIFGYTIDELIGTRADTLFREDCDLDHSFPAPGGARCRPSFDAPARRLLAAQRLRFTIERDTVKWSIPGRNLRIWPACHRSEN